jgi:hypothetical protein
MKEFFTPAELEELRKGLTTIFGQNFTIDQIVPQQSTVLSTAKPITPDVLNAPYPFQKSFHQKENQTMSAAQTQVQKLAGVINLDGLTPNTRHNQQIAAAGMKVLHQNEQTAIAEAERLAQANPGQRFGVFTLTAISQVQKTVTQRV